MEAWLPPPAPSGQGFHPEIIIGRISTSPVTMGRVAPLFSLLSTLTLYLCLSTVIAHRGNRQHDAGLPLQGQGDSRLEPSGTLPQYYTQPSYAYDSPPPYVAVTSSFVSAPASSEYASSDDSMDQTTCAMDDDCGRIA
ncbi:hypothetical protein G6O67_002005 [Ophiocordyceps sinensis]|uniref:Uncharacterized protein n=1 Tax=Ophiocordyceps sinensis TaxID=72228 RepID=A0A8H4PTA0_9HYPO|nr:hypothetical protein G6O67_002005 [Ophiocordyceps sinensis]